MNTETANGGNCRITAVASLLRARALGVVKPERDGRDEGLAESGKALPVLGFGRRTGHRLTVTDYYWNQRVY